MTLPNHTTLPQVSVVIPTHQQKFLAQTLAALAHQETNLPFEVLIVENPRRTRKTRRIIQQARYAPFAIKHLVAPLGANRARNIGARAARGEILAFTDDDCAPAPNWIDRIVTAHHDVPTAGLIGGAVELSFVQPRPPWIVFPLTRMLAEINWKVSRDIPDPGRVTLTDNKKIYMVSANLTCRRIAYQIIGGFEEKHSYAGRRRLIHDEYAMVQGARKHFSPSQIYDDTIKVIHLVRPSRATLSYLRAHAYTLGRREIVLYRLNIENASTLKMYAEVAQHATAGLTDQDELRLARFAIAKDQDYYQFTKHYLITRLAYCQGMLDELRSPQYPVRLSLIGRWYQRLQVWSGHQAIKRIS